MNYKSMFLLTALVLQAQSSLKATEWKDIPNDIKMSIFRKLDISSRGAVALVSKESNKLVDSDDVWRDDLSIADQSQARDMGMLFKKLVEQREKENDKENPIFLILVNRTGMSELKCSVDCVFENPTWKFGASRVKCISGDLVMPSGNWLKMIVRSKELATLFSELDNVNDPHFEISIEGIKLNQKIQRLSKVEIVRSDTMEIEKPEFVLQVTPLKLTK